MKKILLIIVLIIPILANASNIQKAVFAGGCFWCMESDFDHLKATQPGIISVVSGYDGGAVKSPTYHLVSSGTTNYKEVVEVTYDAEKIKYDTLVNFFYTHIDPTVKDRQFCDIGKQYGSAIYFMNVDQKHIAKNVTNKVKKTLDVSVYTEVLPSTKFYKAEEYHQDFYKKNPIRYKYYRWNCGRDQTIHKVWGDKKV
jgi:peptide-methionine (S)-S-oxide reductase